MNKRDPYGGLLPWWCRAAAAISSRWASKVALALFPPKMIVLLHNATKPNLLSYEEKTASTCSIWCRFLYQLDDQELKFLSIAIVWHHFFIAPCAESLIEQHSKHVHYYKNQQRWRNTGSCMHLKPCFKSSVDESWKHQLLENKLMS